MCRVWPRFLRHYKPNQSKEKKQDILKEEIPEEIKELVIARLDELSNKKKISIGSSGDFTKKELIKRIREGDEIGQKMVEIELENAYSVLETALMLLAEDQKDVNELFAQAARKAAKKAANMSKTFRKKAGK